MPRSRLDRPVADLDYAKSITSLFRLARFWFVKLVLLNLNLEHAYQFLRWRASAQYLELSSYHPEMFSEPVLPVGQITFCNCDIDVQEALSSFEDSQ